MHEMRSSSCPRPLPNRVDMSIAPSLLRWLRKPRQFFLASHIYYLFPDGNRELRNFPMKNHRPSDLKRTRLSQYCLVFNPTDLNSEENEFFWQYMPRIRVLGYCPRVPKRVFNGTTHGTCKNQAQIPEGYLHAECPNLSGYQAGTIILSTKATW